MSEARRSPKVLVAVDQLVLVAGGMKVLKLPARGLVEVQLKAPALDLKAGNLAPIQGLDGIAASLPDDDVYLEVPSGGVLRLSQALAVKLPEGVRFQAPKDKGGSAQRGLNGTSRRDESYLAPF